MTEELSSEFPLKSEVQELSSSPTDSVGFNATNDDCLLSLEIKTEPGFCKSDEGEEYSCGNDSTEIKECPIAFKREIKEDGDIEVWTGIQENHIETCSEMQSVAKPFRCSVCSKSFSVKGALSYHLKTHTGKKLFQCSKCDKSFALQNVLVMHMKNHYPKKPYKPDESQRSFIEMSLLKKQVKTYSCIECGNTFSGIGALKNHKRKYHKFKCSVCLRSFNTRSTLGSHFKTHMGKKSFPCKLDMATPTEKFHIDEYWKPSHRNIHTGERTFPCSDCEKSFSSRRGLHIHMRTHTMPFKCIFCRKTFPEKTLLEDHKKNHTVTLKPQVSIRFRTRT